MKELWVVGKNIEEIDTGIVWDLQGVFETKEMAIEACQNEYYFIGPITLNVSLPDETVEWPGCEYPFSIHSFSAL